jgi:hypothetical protein
MNIFCLRQIPWIGVAVVRPGYRLRQRISRETSKRQVLKAASNSDWAAGRIALAAISLNMIRRNVRQADDEHLARYRMARFPAPTVLYLLECRLAFSL